MIKVFNGVLLSVLTVTSAMAGRGLVAGEDTRPSNAFLSQLRHVAASPLVQGEASSSRTLRTRSDGESITLEQLEELTASIEALSIEALDLAGGRVPREAVARANSPHGANTCQSDAALSSLQSTASTARNSDDMQEDQGRGHHHQRQNNDDDDNVSVSEGMPIFLSGYPQDQDPDLSHSLQNRAESAGEGSYLEFLDSPQNVPSTSSATTSGGDPLDGSLSTSSGLSNQFAGLALAGEILAQGNVERSLNNATPDPLVQAVLRITAQGRLVFNRPILPILPRNTGRRNRDAFEDDTASNDVHAALNHVQTINNDDDDNDENSPPPPVNNAKKSRRGGPATN